MKKDLTGQRFGRLVAIRKIQDKWEFQCDCGKICSARADNAISGQTSSCGCLRFELRREHTKTHGLSKTRTYSRWLAMKQRCTDVTHNRYMNYGGRGIKICDRWLYSFQNFLADMGECPEGLTLDRIDNNGDYTPENCRWSTQEEQSLNRSPIYRCSVCRTLGHDKRVCPFRIDHA